MARQKRLSSTWKNYLEDWLEGMDDPGTRNNTYLTQRQWLSSWIDFNAADDADVTTRKLRRYLKQVYKARGSRQRVAKAIVRFHNNFCDPFDKLDPPQFQAKGLRKRNIVMEQSHIEVLQAKAMEAVAALKGQSAAKWNADQF